MGIAVSAHPTPSRSQPVPPPDGKTATRSTPSTKNCHYLPTHCRACGKGLTVVYPLSVTFWKFHCTACNKPYSIEIIGHRKCLVYDQMGRRTVERIGLTQERNTYYRAKCYACNVAVIVPKQAAGTIQSCHHCRMDYTIVESQNEIFYETVIQHQGGPVIFRDKVQTLEGHILHKGKLFFLDEDIANRPQPEWVETLSQLNNEIAALRGQDGSAQTVVMRLQAEKNDLGQRLKQQTDKTVELAGHLRTLESRIQTLSAEKQTHTERADRYDDLIRQLNQKTELVARLENRVEGLNRTVRNLTSEKEALLGKLSGQTELVNNLERQWQQRGKTVPNSAPLEARLRTLQQENQQLETRIQGQSRLEARIVELETEVNLLRHRGQERPEPKEDWYCEEGEESCITPQEKGFQERRILGIKGEPTPERIKAALRKRIRQYHPDRVASMGVELRDLAHRKSQEITRAYSQLMALCAKG